MDDFCVKWSTMETMSYWFIYRAYIGTSKSSVVLYNAQIQVCNDSNTKHVYIFKFCTFASIPEEER